MDRNGKPLTACPACTSRLIYPVSFGSHDPGRVIVQRRCPECEHVDRVACDEAAVAAWVRREHRIRLALVREVLDCEIEAALATSGPAASAA